METHPQTSQRVMVGPFSVHDRPSHEVIREMGDLAGPGRRVAAYALHVGGLNHRHNEEFLAALNSAAVLYADGAAVVALGRIAGARRITRAATTDIGVEIIRRASHSLGRPCRLALIGGVEGVSKEAGANLERVANCEVVLAEHGYHADEMRLTDKATAARPDILFVGLGMPREALWVQRNWERLPETLIMTCGGWFGFLAGQEKRAPKIMQAIGTEWVYRMCQAPRRLATRYASGLISTVRLIPGQLKQRGKNVRHS